MTRELSFADGAWSPETAEDSLSPKEAYYTRLNLQDALTELDTRLKDEEISAAAFIDARHADASREERDRLKDLVITSRGIIGYDPERGVRIAGKYHPYRCALYGLLSAEEVKILTDFAGRISDLKQEAGAIRARIARTHKVTMRRAEPVNARMLTRDYVSGSEWYEMMRWPGAWDDLLNERRGHAAKLLDGGRGYHNLKMIERDLRAEVSTILGPLREQIRTLTLRGEGIEPETSFVYGPTDWMEDDFLRELARYYASPHRRQAKKPNPFAQFQASADEPDVRFDETLEWQWQCLGDNIIKYLEKLAFIEAIEDVIKSDLVPPLEGGRAEKDGSEAVTSESAAGLAGGIWERSETHTIIAWAIIEKMDSTAVKELEDKLTDAVGTGAWKTVRQTQLQRRMGMPRGKLAIGDYRLWLRKWIMDHVPGRARGYAKQLISLHNLSVPDFPESPESPESPENRS